MAPPRRPVIKPVSKTAAPGSTVAAGDRVISVRAEPIELCQLLKFAGLADSGGEAKQLIAERKVLLNGVLETQKRKKVMAGDRVTFGNQSITVKVG